MDDWIQYILAGIIVAIAVFAAVRSFVRASKSRKTLLTACDGCKLQDLCQKPEKNSAKKCDDKVARVENMQ